MASITEDMKLILPGGAANGLESTLLSLALPEQSLVLFKPSLLLSRIVVLIFFVCVVFFPWWGEVRLRHGNGLSTFLQFDIFRRPFDERVVKRAFELDIDGCGKIQNHFLQVVIKLRNCELEKGGEQSETKNITGES